MGRRHRRANPPPAVELFLIDEVRAFHKSITKSQSKTKNKGLLFSVPTSHLIKYCKDTLQSDELASSLSSAAYLYELDQEWVSNACFFCGGWVMDQDYKDHMREEHISQLSSSEMAMKPKLIEESWKAKLKTWDWRPVDLEADGLSEDPGRMKLVEMQNSKEQDTSSGVQNGDMA